MATNKVEIDVVLNSKDAEKGFKKVESGAEAVGESFTSVGKAVSNLGGQSSKALGQVGSSVGEVAESLGGLSSALKAGGAGFTALLGPIGLVAVAVSELYSAYKEYSNEVDGTNIRIEAFKASATELTSIIERLSDAQIQLNLETIKAFRIQSERAQVAIEEAEGLRQKSTALKINIENEQRLIKNIDESIRKAKEQAKTNAQALTFVSGLETERRNRLKAIALLQERLDKITTEADKKALEGNKQRQVTEKMLQDQLKGSPEARKKIADLEAKLLAEARVNELQATKKNLETQRQIARIASEQKIAEIKAIEDISETVRSQAIAGERKRLQAEISDIEKGFAEKRRQEAEKRRQRSLAMQARQRATDLMNERKLQAELDSIRKLELEGMRINGASARELLEARYNDELAKAKDNANLKLAAEMKYQNELTKLEQSEEQARLSQEQAFAEQRQAFIYSTMEFNSQRIEDETERQLAQLELRYNKEIALNEYTQDQITELQRRQAIEREEIVNASIDSQIQKVGEFTNQYGAGLAEAAYNSLLFGESFQESVGQMLIALGRQAAVESLMETAKGTAALFANPALASSHFAAAGLFAGAAATAGLAGKALGGGASGGGGGASSASPTGTPQTAPTPQREQADTQAMVFNINFGGAVIYDTQRAAEQALADRITNLQNTRRRGAPRRSF
jgi:hypothetical protein